MSIPANKLTRQHRVAFLKRLREARALVLRDSEAFHESASVLEYIGQVMKGKIETGLAKYEEQIVELAVTVSGVEEDAVHRQFHVVREARNDAVHDGAYIRHLSSRLVDLLLLLEEAVMDKLQRVKDVMVRNPVVAEPWHLVSHVRREILANSFSTIPILLDKPTPGNWVFLTDSGIMQFLRESTLDLPRIKRLSMTIGDAIEKGMCTESAIPCEPDKLVDDLVPRMKHLPTLVTEKHGKETRLVGIISAFDLL
jgi:CBS domain-containing protein